MKLLKKSMLLCICVALLATTMLTSCGFLEDVVNAITPPDGNDASNEVVLPDYKDFGDDPYRIEIKDGVAVVDFNPCCVEPFVLEIPETDKKGNPTKSVNLTLSEYKGTKNEQGENYDADNVMKQGDWYVQAQKFADFTVGKAVAGLADTDISNVSGCTIYAGGYLAVIVRAAGYAR